MEHLLLLLEKYKSIESIGIKGFALLLISLAIKFIRRIPTFLKEYEESRSLKIDNNKKEFDLNNLKHEKNNKRNTE